MHKFLTFLLVLLALFSFNGVDASLRAVNTSLQTVKSDDEVKLTPLFSEKGDALLTSLLSFRELSKTAKLCEDSLMITFCNAFKKKLEPLNKEIEEYTNALDVVEASKVYRKYRDEACLRLNAEYTEYWNQRLKHSVYSSYEVVDRFHWIGN